MKQGAREPRELERRQALVCAVNLEPKKKEDGEDVRGDAFRIGYADGV